MNGPTTSPGPHPPVEGVNHVPGHFVTYVPGCSRSYHGRLRASRAASPAVTASPKGNAPGHTLCRISSHVHTKVATPRTPSANAAIVSPRRENSASLPVSSRIGIAMQLTRKTNIVAVTTTMPTSSGRQSVGRPKKVQSSMRTKSRPTIGIASTKPAVTRTARKT